MNQIEKFDPVYIFNKQDDIISAGQLGDRSRDHVMVQKQLAKMMTKPGVLPHHPTLSPTHTLFLLFIRKLAL
jgi:hypothetical protein